MNMKLFKNRKYFICIFSLILSNLLFCNHPSIEDIKTNMLVNYQKIKDYSVKVKIKLEMPGLRMPRKKLQLYYKSPDKIKVKTRGFALVPKSGLGGSPLKYLNKLKEIQILGLAEINGKKHWKLVGPILPDSLDFDIGKSDNFPEISMQFWVDADNWMLTKIETLLDTVPIFDIYNEYIEIEGVFLPEKTKIEMSLEILKNWDFRDPVGGPATDHSEFHEMVEGMNLSEEFSGKMTIQFSNYKVNLGIDDSIFEEK